MGFLDNAALDVRVGPIASFWWCAVTSSLTSWPDVSKAIGMC